MRRRARAQTVPLSPSPDIGQDLGERNTENVMPLYHDCPKSGEVLNCSHIHVGSEMVTAYACGILVPGSLDRACSVGADDAGAEKASVVLMYCVGSDLALSGNFDGRSRVQEEVSDIFGRVSRCLNSMRDSVFLANDCFLKGARLRRIASRTWRKMSYTIALIYERKQDYLAKGFSLDQTEDLWVESDTIDAITSTLESLGHTVTQVGDIKDLVACLATNRHGLWDLVFSLSVGLHGLLREVQVPALLEAYQIPFIGADAASSAFSHNKANTKV